METETFAFQAEINQLLSLIINAFYSNKDVFLRELVSNASDALDKVRYGAKNQSIEHSIKIIPNKEAKTLAIMDTGIGMSKDDLVANLGTIAKSGTRAFMENLKDAKTELIGQFGVGFYSAYLVSHHVDVVSKAEDDPHAWVWSSEAGGSFTVGPASEEQARMVGPRGTCILMKLKDDQVQYLEEQTIRDVIKRHCEFIGYPIILLTIRDVPVEDAGDDDDEDGKVTVEDATPKPQKMVQKSEWVTLNSQKPVWLRAPEDVTHEEYASFYKSFTNDWEDQLAHKHFSVEGQLTFKSLLFLPKRAPFDMFDVRFGRTKGSIKLYVRRVFITDTATSDDSLLLPDYLNFVRGIVDSDDLPLNISREHLQQSRILKLIRKTLVKKTLEMLTDLMTDKPEDFKTFYGQFSKNLKLGVHEDDQNRDKLVKFLRFHTSKSGEDQVSLKDYVDRMPEDQKTLFYIAGESLKAVQNSPCIEKLKEKGYEVLFLTEPMDEYMMQRLRDYDGRAFVSCTREGFKIHPDDPEPSGDHPLCKRIQEVLGERVTKVLVSPRLSKTPCILVTEQYAWTANMERIMKAQALQTGGNLANSNSRKIFEVNLDNALIKHLESIDDADKFGSILGLLYDSTLLNSGFSIDDPTAYAERVFRMLQAGLGISEDEEDNIEMPPLATQDEQCILEELD